ncbi:primosomal protein [bacterium]|nr:primosomal protein [bacterium]
MKLGQYDDAMRVYADLASRKPDDSRYLYNAGVAAYKAQKFQEAQEYFDASSLSSDLGLQQQSFYNRGNALYKAGESEAEFEKKAQLWKEALDQFDHAVKLNDTDNLATENLQFVKTQLENLQEQEQENQPNEDQNEDQNEDDKQDDQKDQDKQQQDNQKDQDQQQQDNQKDQDQQQQENEEDSSEGNNQDPSSEEDQEDLKQGNQDQENPEKPEEQEQKQSSKSDENQDEEEASADQPEEGKGNEAETAATTMTPQQAMQLLESAKDEAKALIFKPQENKRKQRFKDW